MYITIGDTKQPVNYFTNKPSFNAQSNNIYIHKQYVQ
jgi:hypothetical protein